MHIMMYIVFNIGSIYLFQFLQVLGTAIFYDIGGTDA